MPIATALSIWITVDVEIDTCLSPQAAVLHTATVARRACVEIHEVCMVLR